MKEPTWSPEAYDFVGHSPCPHNAPLLGKDPKTGEIHWETAQPALQAHCVTCMNSAQREVEREARIDALEEAIGKLKVRQGSADREIHELKSHRHRRFGR